MHDTPQTTTTPGRIDPSPARPHPRHRARLHRHLRATLGLGLAACLALGCDAAEDDEALTDPEEIRLEVLSVAGFDVLREQDPVPSLVVPDTMIRVLVSDDFSEEYALIDPDVPGSEIDMPPGALVIRQLITPEGEPDGFTMVTLGPPMSNEDAGDLWFGALDADGQWKLDADGQPMYGAIESCSGCHAQRESDGFLFGMPHMQGR